MFKNKIHLNGVPEGDERQNEVQVLFEAIIAENFHE